MPCSPGSGAGIMVIDEAYLREHAVERTQLAGHDGRSGAQIARVRLDDGRDVIVKVASPDNDLTMLATGDTRGRELSLWERGVLDRLPAGVRHTILGGWRLDSGEVVTVMRDVGAAVVGWDRRLSRSECRDLLAAVARMHHTFRGERIDGLCAIEDWLLLLGPGSMADRPDGELAQAVARGWQHFVELVPAEVVDAVFGVFDDPAPLARSLRRAGTTLLHGDLWLVNAALEDDAVVLLDWAIATDGPPELELANFLTGNVTQVDASPEEMIDDFRSVSLDPIDDDVLRCALMAGTCLMGWNKALDAATNDDPAVRERERVQLEWWSAAVRNALDAGSF